MISPMKTSLEKVRRFVFHDLWTVQATETTGPFRLVVRTLRVCVLVIRGFSDDALPVHAAALTFATVMSLIPIMAIIFSVLQAIGVGGEQIHALTEWTQQMPVETQEFIERILDVAQKTNFAALGGIGVVVLLIFATAVLSNIENSFNRIWGIRKSRNPVRRTINYISIIVVVPVLIAVSGTVSAFLNSPALVSRMGSISFIYTFLITFPALCHDVACFLLSVYRATEYTRKNKTGDLGESDWSHRLIGLAIYLYRFSSGRGAS